MRRVMKRLKKRKASSGGRAASGIEEASEGDRSTKTFRAANRNEEEEENVGKKPEEEDEEEEEEEEGGREEEEEEEEEGEDEEEEVAAVDSMADRLQQEHINQPPKVLHDHGPYQAAPIHLLLQQALSLHQPHLPPPSSHMEEEDEEEEEEPHFPPSQQQQGPPFYFQLEMLPLEVALHIMSLLDVRSLCVASRVSRVYRRLAEDDTLWFALYRSRWMRSGSTCFVGYGWKQRYCERLGLNKKWNFEVNDQKFFRKPQVFEASRPTAKFSVRKLQVDDNLLVASVEHLSGDVCMLLYLFSSSFSSLFSSLTFSLTPQGNSLQIWGLHTTSHESLYSVPAIVSFHFQGSLCVSGCSNGVVQVWDIGLNARPLGSFSLQPQTFGSMRERRPPRVTNVFIDMHESNCILASDSYSCVHVCSPPFIIISFFRLFVISHLFLSLSVFFISSFLHFFIFALSLFCSFSTFALASPPNA
ncbi:SH3-binding domain containing protein, variant 2 [Balamuthia mandrillaris]